MNKPITVNELLDACKKQVSAGNGEKVIMISNDDEGNGYHYLWYEFILASKMAQDLDDEGFPYEEFDGLDERIASVEDTIILG
jgi:hypothetical protein